MKGKKLDLCSLITAAAKATETNRCQSKPYFPPRVALVSFPSVVLSLHRSSLLPELFSAVDGKVTKQRNSSNKMEQQLLSSAIDGGGGGDNANDSSRAPPSTSRAVPPEGADVTYHTPAWHAARLAALNNVQRKSWEEFKAEQKAEAAMTRQAEAETEEAQRAFRAQLDADRARRLAHGVNQADLRKVLEAKERKKKKHKKDKRKKSSSSKRKSGSKKDKKKSSKKRSSKDKKKSKRRRRSRSRSRSRSDDSSSSRDSSSSSDSSGSSSSSDSGSDSEEEARRKRRREDKKEKRKDGGGGDDDGNGPDEALRLSAFLTSGK